MTWQEASAEADQVIRVGAGFFSSDFRLLIVESVGPYLGANWIHHPGTRRVLASDGNYHNLTPNHIIRRTS